MRQQSHSPALFVEGLGRVVAFVEMQKYARVAPPLRQQLCATQEPRGNALPPGIGSHGHVEDVEAEGPRGGEGRGQEGIRRCEGHHDDTFDATLILRHDTVTARIMERGKIKKEGKVRLEGIQQYMATKTTRVEQRNTF